MLFQRFKVFRERIPPNPAPCRVCLALGRTSWWSSCERFALFFEYEFFRACSYEPSLVGKLTWVGVLCSYDCTFLSHLISRLSGTKLCKYDFFVFEIFFVEITNSTLYTTLLLSVCLLMFILFFVFFNYAVQYYILGQNGQKYPSRLGGIKCSYGKFYHTWPLRPHLARD